MPSSSTLDEVARAVADGERVDWTDLDQTDENLAALHDLEALSAAFREVSAGDGSDSGVMQPPDQVMFVWGHLQVLEPIGSGTSGDVYRAFDPLLQREVALKLWRQEEGLPTPGRRRTLREARLLARIRHPHVVTVHGADVHDGRAGLWTDLVRGETLETGLAARGTSSADEATLVGIDLCRALAAVHGSGLVHGDVKAANVMREDGGRIVLTDFSAGAENGGGASPASFATPLAAAPEILRGLRPTPAADLYALGVLLYRLVTSRYPFEADTVGRLQELQDKGRATPLTDLRPDLPSGFVEAVERALATDPAERYQSAGAMERALVRALSESDDAARKQRGWRRWLLVAAAVALAAVAAVPALRSLRDGHAAGVRAVAVLPFETGPETPEFMGAATAVALRERLEALTGLEVVPTVAALRVPDIAGDPRGDGSVNGSAAVLHGSVDASPERTRLTLELLSDADGGSLWATTVSGAPGSLEELEDTAGRRLARALRLSPAAVPAAIGSPGEGTGWETHHALLAGRFYTDRRTSAALTQAVACYQKAIESNPELAAAHAGLARTWALTASLDSATLPSNRTWARSRAAALRALQQDPDLAAAHVALAEVAFRHDWDWTIAELELSRALALEPDHPDGLEVLAELLSVTGRHEEALATINRAVTASPLSAPLRTTAGFVSLEAGRFDQAVEDLEAARRLDPGYYAAYTVLGSVYEERGLAAEAVEQWQNGLVLAGQPAAQAEEIGRAFATAGMPGVWHWRLVRLERERDKGHESAALLARAHAALGHKDEALRWLARAVEQHDYRFLQSKEEPAFDSVRATPEFAALRTELSLDGGMVAAAIPAAGRPLAIEAALYRDRGGRAEALASGAATRPGDRLFLAVICQEPIHLYVLNEDRRGNLFVLFPLPDLELVNPLPARRRHRLPGAREGVAQNWVVTSAGGRETILVVAARAALPEVEVEIGQLRVADAGRSVRPLLHGSPGSPQVRGVGGLAAESPSAQSAPTSRLTRLAAQLAERAARGEVWLRQYVLENPGG